MKTSRFNPTFSERLEQSKKTKKPPLMKLKGYRLYRIDKEPTKTEPEETWSQAVGRSQRKTTPTKVKTLPDPWAAAAGMNVGQLVTAYGGIGMGKSHYAAQISYSFMFDADFKPQHKTRWLKPKKATLMRLQGYKLTEIED